TAANWANIVAPNGPPNLGYPAASYFEAAQIGNNTTVVVNTSLTNSDQLGTDEATGGVTLGQTAGSTGGLTIQSGGNLLAKGGTDTVNTVTGAVFVGTNGIGTLTINNGGTMTATSLTLGGQTLSGNQSALNVGDGGAGT